MDTLCVPQVPNNSTGLLMRILSATAFIFLVNRPEDAFVALLKNRVDRVIILQT